MRIGDHRLRLFVVFVVLQGWFAATEVDALPKRVDFAAGQEWTIKSASLKAAKIIVGRVEPWRNTVCVSISIVDIPIPRGMPGAGGVTEIAHIPFDEMALAASTDRLIATGVSPSPNFENGYKQWQDAKGGIYTISVEKAIEIMFQTIDRRQG